MSTVAEPHASKRRAVGIQPGTLPAAEFDTARLFARLLEELSGSIRAAMGTGL
jgi:hypothetical protein